MIKKIICLIIIIAILIVPIPMKLKDGGTTVYCALTYKVVSWHRIQSDSETYKNTCVYWFPDNFKDIDELWELRP